VFREVDFGMDSNKGANIAKQKLSERTFQFTAVIGIAE
jgi:hypothetical protein